ncbi:VCBS repeat-containing protein [Nonomuraea sp. NPDC050310]|uniref:FG-GAP repeat domain-containing protein n=1 Tax=Nonomuraea sp. NPDC050310 TaxID=3154935 RepID=UPI0033C81545
MSTLPRLTATAALSLLALAGLSGPVTADPFPPDPAFQAAYVTAPCVAGGPTAADAALADRLDPVLTGRLANAMTAYRVSCARMVVKAVRDRGLPKHAAVIAVTTTIPETNIENIAEKVDHDSLGLFQQRDSWGSEADRLDPIWATNRFLDKMIRLYPNGSWADAEVGVVCQAVQVSAYAERYQPEVADARKIVDALWAPPGSDFNRDGVGDVLSTATDRITIWPGTGANSFGTAASLPGTGWSNYSKPVANDFTGDGKSDLAAVKDDKLVIWPGGATPNSFGTAITLTGIGWNKFASTLMSPGDLNRDGHADLAATFNDQLWLWNGDGQGSFGAAFSLPGTGWAPYTRPVGGDFNGDGIGDFAGIKDDKLTFWYGNGSNSIASVNPLPGTGWNKYAATLIAPGDLNRDGRDDLAGVYNDKITLWNPTATGIGATTPLPGTGWGAYFPA